MQMVIYDGSFEGLLSAVFDIYTYRFTDVEILQHGGQKNLFGAVHDVTTDMQKARRVWKGLQQKLSETACLRLYQTWLSEIAGIDNTLLQYMQYAFSSAVPVEEDFSHPAVLTITATAKKVHREKHRMEAFVRFQLTQDQLYYAIVEPDFNVLPLIRPHFQRRFADQRWLIFDARRHYGLHYDLTAVSVVNIAFNDSRNGKDITAMYDAHETLYQHLWQRYFGSVNIAARKNTRLHIRHMPKRYWKYLPEKYS